MRPRTLFHAGLCPLLAALAACSDAPIAPTNPDPTCPTSLSLRRGEVRAIADAAGLSCIGFAGATEATQYLIVTANSARTSDDTRSYLIRTGGTIGAVASASSFGRLSIADDTLRERVEGQVRDGEQRLLAGRSLAFLARQATRAMPNRATAAAPRVGDTLTFHVPDASSHDLCANYADVRGVVKAISAKALVVLDVAAPPRGFTDADFRASAEEFDNLILPLDTQWFGMPTDMNGDGRFTILFTPRINRLTPTGSLGYVGGFFFGSDLMPRSIPSQGWKCDSSNEQEIFYLLAPDPDGTVNGNRFSLATALESSRGTTAHELQHMINQGVRQTVSHADRLEVAWLNEGLSHFAEEIVGRASRGYPDGKRLTWDDVLFELDDFDSFFRQNLIRYRVWLDRPDLWSPISGKALTELGSRGASWAFLRYSADQYATADARAFVRSLAAGPEVDVANIEARTHASFEDLLSGFLVASFADSATAATSPRFAYRSWAMRDVMTNLNGGDYPLRVTTLPASDVATTSPSGSGNYFLLSRPAGAAATAVRMLSTAGALVDFGTARAYVVRLK